MINFSTYNGTYQPGWRGMQKRTGVGPGRVVNEQIEERMIVLFDSETVTKTHHRWRQ